MKVETFLFGSVEIDPNVVITFPDGLIGLEDCKRYCLIHPQDVSAPHSFTLQSMDVPELAFEIIDPTSLGFHYELALNDSESGTLQLAQPDDAAVLVVVYKQGEDQSGISANLRAPLILNPQARLGLQKVMVQVSPNVLLSNLSSGV
ncbi:MAG: hypothetical protein RIR00_1127 [Pseudomonadota bacterium]